jgi:RNA-directed DNA polymerase
MIEKILQGKNMQKALRQTIANKGASGVDGMMVTQLRDYFRTDQIKLYTRILNHSYTAQPIRGVEIPKPNGKTRLLGVPTVVDRTLQQAVSQIIAPYFERDSKHTAMVSARIAMPTKQCYKPRRISMKGIAIL